MHLTYALVWNVMTGNQIDWKTLIDILQYNGCPDAEALFFLCGLSLACCQ